MYQTSSFFFEYRLMPVNSSIRVMIEQQFDTNKYCLFLPLFLSGWDAVKTTKGPVKTKGFRYLHATLTALTAFKGSINSGYR